MENEKNIKIWDDLNLKEELLRGIYAYGFEQPSEIQKKAIYPIINKKDVIAQAQSGTGKTGTFSISTLQNIIVEEETTQAVILTTTRELAIQSHSVITGLSAFIEKVKIKLLTGGTSVNEDIRYLSNTEPHVIVGTPGRVFDMIKRRKINMSKIKLFVLDEADEMLSSGFKDQIKTIFSYFNENVQTAIFSATIPREVISITSQFMNNPLHLTIKAQDLTLEGIKQYFIAAKDDQNKYEQLRELFNRIDNTQSIIFVNGINRVNSLHEAMEKDQFQACKIHSSLTKEDRANALKEIKNGSCNILISSDLTARGIDIQQISLVINFDIPRDVNTYLHRIGRSGRWGRKGDAINFICERDVYMMKKIENHYKVNIEEYKI